MESTYETGDTIAAEDLEPGDHWDCTATPSDGTASGPSDTADVTIGGGCGEWSVDFNGSSDYAEGPHPAILVGTTVEVWFEADVIDSERVIVSKYWHGNNSVSEFLIRIQPGGYVRVATKGTDTLTAATAITTGTWHHVALVINGVSSKLYMDGTLSAQGSLATPNNGGLPLRFGYYSGSNYVTTSWFNGRIGSARTSTGIRYTSNFTPAPQLEVDATTIALWDFEEGAGNTYADSGPGGYGGTLSGPTWVVDSPCP